MKEDLVATLAQLSAGVHTGNGGNFRRFWRSPLDEYKRTEEEDSRFIDYYSTGQSIVTSNAQNDGGMFETNLRDERFLPFEGAGAESTWKLELPAEFRQFDYSSISDVILHLRYTAMLFSVAYINS